MLLIYISVGHHFERSAGPCRWKSVNCGLNRNLHSENTVLLYNFSFSFQPKSSRPGTSFKHVEESVLHVCSSIMAIDGPIDMPISGRSFQADTWICTRLKFMMSVG